MDAEEIWKDVKGYEGLYKVSNFGRIKSLHRKKEVILIPSKTFKGYLIVNLWKGKHKRNYRVHRLVYEAFVGEIPKWIANAKGDERMEVNHIDEDKTNNCLWNLELITQKQNVNHGTYNERLSKSMTNNPFNSTQVYQYTFDLKLVKKYPSQAECRRCGYNQADISLCCNGKRKSYKGFIWSFKPL